MSQAPQHEGEEVPGHIEDESPANDQYEAQANDNREAPANDNQEAQSANDNSEISDEDREVIGVMNSVADQVHEVYLHPSVENGLFKAIDYIDESYLMNKVRVVWNSNRFPDIAKWALVHIPQIHPTAPFVKLFVRTGLLEYNEDEAKAINGFDKMILDKAISIGSLLEPALIPLKPLIKPIQRVMDAQDQVFDKMREHLKDKHEGDMMKENMAKAA